MRHGTSAAFAAAIICIYIGLGSGYAQPPGRPASEPDLILAPEVSPRQNSPAAIVPPAPPALLKTKEADLALQPVPNGTPAAPPAMLPPTLAANAPATVAPTVAVELIAPETANVGQPIAYELIVRNNGKSTVTQVHVEQELPAGMRCLGCEPSCEHASEHLLWNLGQLEAGAERRIKVTAQSSGEGELRSRANVTFSTACAQVTRVTRPKLAVSMSGPDTVLVGEPVTFQIKLTNTGTGPITKLMLRDRLPAGLQHPQGNLIEAEVGGLAPGETRTLALKATAVRPGQLANEIVAIAGTGTGSEIRLAGANGPHNPDLEASAKVDVRILEPGLQIRLSGPKACLIKCEALFSIDVTNPGSAASKNIHIVNHLPEGMDFVAASDDGHFDPATRSVTWALLGQEPAAQRVLTVKTRGTALAETVDSVMAQADGNLTAKAELAVKVEGIPALSLEVSDPDDPGPIGTDFLYEIRVLNQGSCPCTGIQIIAQMPDGMELRETTAPAPYKVVGQQVQFAPFAKLATKADLVYRLKVRSAVAGDVRFRVQLTCDQLQQPVRKEESSRFYKP